ncbi:RIIa domain-containing protein 1 [Anolis carolinensis]|uniref:RIIa domain-containing protein 1 n=1 Tax=Anolis carolinensis TaxID=28377 RepID=UPI0007DB6BA4|nr:PREDICTED: RIIa domain-containing protein 1 [Anolis carolinensis]|eukprot:XP_016854910.1 PREDICTED: RIIa domain-containing protein 1 [Anolis carolinensis]
MVDITSGLESLDVGSLHGKQYDRLLTFKINTKIENERYLRSHKEVGLMLSGFIREVLLQRPENIREFAADYFTNPDLPAKIEKEMMDKANAAI